MQKKYTNIVIFLQDLFGALDAAAGSSRISICRLARMQKKLHSHAFQGKMLKNTNLRQKTQIARRDAKYVIHMY